MSDYITEQEKEVWMYNSYLGNKKSIKNLKKSPYI
jgi:hypothetical protein